MRNNVWTVCFHNLSNKAGIPNVTLYHPPFTTMSCTQPLQILLATYAAEIV